MKNLFLALLSLSIVAGFVHFSSDVLSGMFLTESESHKSAWPVALIGIAMLAGIIAGRMHNMLATTQELQPRKFLVGLGRDKELWKSLLASPIVFGVVYALLSKSNDLVVSAIFSFQNGFFCDVILRKKEREVSGRN